MQTYDVIIVGAGPAGLRCAEILSASDLRVLLIEKDELFGDKVCAGGLTRKDLAILDLPDSILEHKIHDTAVHSRKHKSGTKSPVPFVFTVSRKQLGSWQRERLADTNVEVITASKVTHIEDGKVVVNDDIQYGYEYLVGADGYFSAVRKFLDLPVEKRLIGIQYMIPGNAAPLLEIYLNSRFFHSWYGWIFPHDGSIAVGCIGDPKIISPRKLKVNFHEWLKQQEIDISAAHYQSYPISYDYRGFHFGNTFLAGEAAGLASGLTGEGIYQSLVSGETVARTILDKNHVSEAMAAVIKYNRIQEKILRFLVLAGPLRSLFHELIIMLLNNKRMKKKINNSFS